MSDASNVPTYILLALPIVISWSWVGHSVSASSYFLVYWLTFLLAQDFQMHTFPSGPITCRLPIVSLLGSLELGRVNMDGGEGGAAPRPKRMRANLPPFR